jgi:nitrogenase molybdenum-iron protein NifN
MFREPEDIPKAAGVKPLSYVSVRNACKLCSPLGASLVFKGIRGCLPMLHGSQGCATYIRRYLISHFKEPVDIASSSFSEESTIFGGSKNFCQGIDNVISQYHPEVIGLASTCLSETIGEDIDGLIKSYCSINKAKKLPHFIHASTPSYKGTHMDGFHEAVLSTVRSLAGKQGGGNHINVFPGFVSPADIRHLKEILYTFGTAFVLLPDYSETLDGVHMKDYQIISEGGTPVEEIVQTGSAKATIELGTLLNNESSAGTWLMQNRQVKNIRLTMPIGIKQTDAFLKTLELVTGEPTPDYLQKQRGRLIDAYVDGHKHVFGKRAIVYGEEDFVIGLVAFLSEIGIKTVLAGSGAESNKLKHAIKEVCGETSEDMIVLNGIDFEHINEMADKLEPDLFIGNSKGYYIARRLRKPLVRVGFPVHDRFGGQRLQHLCYEGTHQLFDNVVNALIEHRQENSPVGYKYI